MAHRQAVIQHGFLEGERASDQERHQIVAPDVADIGGLGHQFAILPYAVARDIAADIDVLAQFGQRGIARLGHGQQGTRFWVALAEMQEIRRQRTRQDGQIGLHMARGKVGGGSRQLAAARVQSRLAGQLNTAAHCKIRCHAESSCGHVGMGTLHRNYGQPSNHMFR
ncbi:hypothetical protein D3C87_1572470 [compost metagenome]